METDHKTQWKTPGDAETPLETTDALEKKANLDTPSHSDKISGKEVDEAHTIADNEHDAFARQDVNWSADEERALVRRLGAY
jgi:hypothetical protein